MKRRVVLACSLVLLVVLQGVLPASAQEDGPTTAVTGAGQFQYSDGTLVPFVYVAIKDADGQVHGEFYQNQTGTIYVGRVTCLTVDPVNHRAWVGGSVVYSNDPTPDHQVGDAIWFRVVDYGSTNPDRSTFFGFKGAAGFDTSAAYCAGMPWAAGDARTWPVTRGDIQVHS
jgi:hypothetical protein